MRLLPILISILLTHQLVAQKTLPLYPDKIPNSKSVPNEETSTQEGSVTIVRNITVPTITHYPAPSNIATGTAVIVIPGGGYAINAISHEGHDIARKINEIGVTAFVVKYRIPNDRSMENKEIGPLQDAQQAIKTVRENATTYGIDANKIGILGFSAGGHLASTAGTHYKTSHVANPKNVSLRPDFMVLVYPVISFQEDIGHLGSRDNLLGKGASKDKVDLYSNEKQVTKETPPTFLIHAGDDKTVPVANSLRFYESLQQKGVKAELHIYPEGGHGFGLNNGTTKDEWFERCKNWMDANGWLTKK